MNRGRNLKNLIFAIKILKSTERENDRKRKKKNIKKGVVIHRSQN